MNNASSVHRITSADGTAIAYERLGDGEPAVVLVAGATCDRAITRPLAEALAEDFTVINYDRRGRGDSGDASPYAIDREIEDLAALIGEAGRPTAVYGHSSGAGLVLHAAAHGLPLASIVLHDAPYTPFTEEDMRTAREYGVQLRALLAEGRNGDAAALFLSTVGMPEEMIGQMREDPSWSRMEAVAPTLAYDSEVMGDYSNGGRVPTRLAGRASVPALVLCGGADYPWMLDTGRELAASLPNGRFRVLEGHSHAVPPEVLAPVLKEFLLGALPEPEAAGRL